MKLTKEQAKDAADSWGDHCYIYSLSEWLEIYEFPDPPAESMWIWGGDRLPTKEDADCDGDVFCFNPEINTIGGRPYGHFSLKYKFWTPAPKHLKKPEPPDPFEAFWKRYCIDEDGYTGDEKKAHMRQAFLAGQQSQNK